MIGIDKQLLPVAEVIENSTWIVDLDTDKLWRSPQRNIRVQDRSQEDDVRPNLPRKPQEILLG